MKVNELLTEHIQGCIFRDRKGAPWLERACSAVLRVSKEVNRSKRPINSFERSDIGFLTTHKAQELLIAVKKSVRLHYLIDS